MPGWENVSFTHTIDGNRAYVRLGAVAMRPPDGDQRDCEETCLVCLNLIPDHGRFLPLWQTRPQDVVAGPAMFEGSPTVFNGRVTIAVAIFSGVQVTTAIVCLDAETGTRLWTRKVCEASELKGEPRVRHYLLTAAGPEHYLLHPFRGDRRARRNDRSTRVGAPVSESWSPDCCRRPVAPRPCSVRLVAGTCFRRSGGL